MGFEIGLSFFVLGSFEINIWSFLGFLGTTKDGGEVAGSVRRI